MAFAVINTVLKLDTKELNANLRTAQVGFKKFASENQEELRAVGIGLAAVGTAVTAIGGLSLKASAQFSQGMANVLTLVRDVDGAIRKDFTVGVKELSLEFGVTTQDLTTSLFDIQSATGDATSAVDKLGAATALAVGGNTSLTDSTKGLLTLMESYGDQLGGASDAADLLFKAQEKARATVGELAVASGQFLPIAKQLGVDVNELFGVFSQTTVAIGDTAQSSTALKGVLNGLLQPSEALKELMGEWGVETGFAAVEQFGLIGILEKLSDLEKDRIPELFGNIRALTGLGAVLQDTNKLRQFALDIGNREGAVAAAVAIQQEELANQMKRVQQAFNAVAIEIGEALTPAVSKFLNESLLPSVKGIKDWINENESLAKSLITMASAVGLALIPLGLLFAFLPGMAIAASGLLKAVILLNGAFTASVAPSAKATAGYAAVHGMQLNLARSTFSLRAALLTTVPLFTALIPILGAAALAYFGISKAAGGLVDALDEKNKSLANSTQFITRNIQILAELEAQENALSVAEARRVAGLKAELAQMAVQFEQLLRAKDLDRDALDAITRRTAAITSEVAILQRSKVVREETTEAIEEVAEVTALYSEDLGKLIAEEVEQEGTLIRLTEEYRRLRQEFEDGSITQQDYQRQLGQLTNFFSELEGSVDGALELITRLNEEGTKVEFDLSIVGGPERVQEIKDRIRRANEEIVLNTLEGRARIEKQAEFDHTRALERIEEEKKELLKKLVIEEIETNRILQNRLANLELFSNALGVSVAEAEELARREADTRIESASRATELILALLDEEITTEGLRFDQLLGNITDEIDLRDKLTDRINNQTDALGRNATAGQGAGQASGLSGINAPFGAFGVGGFGSNTAEFGSFFGSKLTEGVTEAAKKSVRASAVAAGSLIGRVLIAGAQSSIQTQQASSTGQTSTTPSPSQIITSSGIGVRSFQTGTDFVPNTGFFKLHRGEKVIPAGENASNLGAAGGNQGGGGVTVINLIDESMVTAIMAENPNAVINIINSDIIKNGPTRRIIKAVE